jgi:hypothetical protein
MECKWNERWLVPPLSDDVVDDLLVHLLQCLQTIGGVQYDSENNEFFMPPKIIRECEHIQAMSQVAWECVPSLNTEQLIHYLTDDPVLQAECHTLYPVMLAALSYPQHIRFPEVLGDGNCFYRSYSVLMFGNQLWHKLMRLHCAIEVMVNVHTYISGTPSLLLWGSNKACWQQRAREATQYITEALKNGCLVHSGQAAPLANVLGRCINVHCPIKHDEYQLQGKCFKPCFWADQGVGRDALHATYINTSLSREVNHFVPIAVASRFQIPGNVVSQAFDCIPARVIYRDLTNTLPSTIMSDMTSDESHHSNDAHTTNTCERQHIQHNDVHVKNGILEDDVRDMLQDAKTFLAAGNTLVSWLSIYVAMGYKARGVPAEPFRKTWEEHVMPKLEDNHNTKHTGTCYSSSTHDVSHYEPTPPPFCFSSNNIM